MIRSHVSNLISSIVSTPVCTTGTDNPKRPHARSRAFLTGTKLLTSSMGNGLFFQGVFICAALACTGCRGLSDMQDPFAAAEVESGRQRPGVTRVAKAHQDEHDSAGRVELGGGQAIVDPFLAADNEPAFH